MVIAKKVNQLKPMFTVVIPLHNKRDHIIRAINSVLLQTYEAYEVIIIDDGSTDGSPNMVDSKFYDSVKLIRQVNLGISGARNKGVKEAKGDIIAFLDADDTWEPHFLEEMCALKFKFPEANCLVSSYQFKLNEKYIDPKVRFSKKVKEPRLLDDYFSVCAKGDLPFIISSFCITRNSFLKSGGFAEDIAIGEGQDLFSRLAINEIIAYSPSVLSFYNLDSYNRAGQQVVPDKECSFSKRVLSYSNDKSLNDRAREDMVNYTASHLLYIASLNIKMGRLDTGKRLLDEKRCQRQPIRYLWWLAYYWYRKLTTPESTLALI
jgi:glycosyltransferase involved in cell wall biosynthesis